LRCWPKDEAERITGIERPFDSHTFPTHTVSAITV